MFKGNKGIHEDEAFVVPKEDEEQIYEDCDNNITQNLSDDESSIALGTDVYVFDKGIIGCHIKDDTINLKFCDGPKKNSIVGIIGEYTQDPEEDIFDRGSWFAAQRKPEEQYTNNRWALSGAEQWQIECNEF